MARNHRFIFTIDPEVKKALARRARVRHCTMSLIVNKALREFLEKPLKRTTGAR
jgi:predicted transcriptional regulator